MATPAKISVTNLPSVVLIGRVNVGKSTLFNRLTESAHALVSEVPGTTRTRNIKNVVWRGKNFQLVDTGGLTFDNDIQFEKEVVEQTDVALSEADLIIFVIDLKNGILPQEKELAKKIQRKYKNKTPIILVGNKADTAVDRERVHDKEWSSLTLGTPFPVSAINGSNAGDLLDLIYKNLSKAKTRPKKITETSAIKVALIGKPNVGKSLLFNKLIGQDRVIVSSIAHTTREPHDTLVEVDKDKIIFIDTAGIRKKTKINHELERQGIGKSLEAIERADVILFVIDASEPISDQDKQLGGFLQKHAKSVILIINKWDLAEENDDTMRNEAKATIIKYFPHLDYAPIIFVSALTQYKVHQIFPLIRQAIEGKKTIVSDDELREFLNRMMKLHKPSRGKGVRHPKILGFKQIDSNPPVFEIAIKQKTSLHVSYVYFLKRRMRQQWNFFASPIIIKMKKMKR